MALPPIEDAHGGGDLRLLRMLHEHLTEGSHGALVTSLERSFPSHALAFLAEDSRRDGAVKVPVPEVFSPGAIERLRRAQRRT